MIRSEEFFWINFDYNVSLFKIYMNELFLQNFYTSMTHLLEQFR